MGATRRTEDSIAASLRDHVSGPVSTATAVVAAELEEVDAEREAFEAFEDRVAGVDTVSMSRSTPQSQRPGFVQSRPRCAERVRNAFRETVMSVDHYDDLYGETLEEHFAAELSPDLLAGLREGAGSQFTDLYKRTLLGAVSAAVEQREAFCDILENERASLETCAAELDALVDDLDGTRVPAHVRVEFAETLDDVARRRQETFAGRTSSPRTDGHDLCGYLYADCEWTYPVLTSVTRLRSTVNGLVA
jgi:hypothetical protein